MESKMNFHAVLFTDFLLYRKNLNLNTKYCPRFLRNIKIVVTYARFIHNISSHVIFVVIAGMFLYALIDRYPEYSIILCLLLTIYLYIGLKFMICIIFSCICYIHIVSMYLKYRFNQIFENYNQG